MKKTIIAIIAIVAVVAIVVGGIFVIRNRGGQAGNTSSSSKYETAEDLKKLVDDIYAKSENDLFGLETRELELDTEDGEMALPTYTGLTSKENIDKVVISECMVTSQPYSVALVKVAKGADVEAIKEQMVNNIDMRRWICVIPEVVYVTNYEDVIFLVIANKELAEPQYDAFKEVVGGNIGKKLEREAEIPEF